MLTREQEQVVLEYLATMQSLIYSEQCVKTVADVKDKDIVIFIGNTRAGKSTVVNYIIGNALNAVKYKKKNFKIVKNVESDEGPVIGSEATSETTIPTAWNSTRIQGLIVDAPGFDDNRGEAQDVANAFYIKEMITSANSIKFVLITDINDIVNDNIGQFLNFVDKIHTILPQCDTLLKGIVVVFNKDRDDTTKEEMCEYLTTKIIRQEKIKMKNRVLVNHLIYNPNSFVICPTPTDEGLCDNIFEMIDKAIENNTEILPKHLLSNITPGISDRSRCFLLEAHNYFTEFKELDDLLTAIEINFDKNVIPSDLNKSVDDMKGIKKSLTEAEENLRNLLNCQVNIKDLLLAIGQYLPNVNELKEGGNVYMKLDFVKFVDEILNIEESNMFRVKVNSALTKMKDRVTMCRINVQERMFEITSEEANQRYKEMVDQQKQDQIEYFKKINEMQQKQIEMLANLKSQSSRCVIQ